jgi:hypothetical protein
MRVYLRTILMVVLLASVLSGCVTPYKRQQDNLPQQNHYGREEVEYYQVKLSIPFW